MEVKVHIFRMPAVNIGEWTPSRSDCFVPEERSSGTCFVGVYHEVIDPVRGGGTVRRMLSGTILISFSSLIFTRKLNASSVRSHFTDNLLIGPFIAVTS